MTYNENLTEVWNAWTVYGIEQDGTESGEPFAELRRPQDWGDSRWSYQEFLFEYTAGTHTYRNHVHCWTDMKRNPQQMATLFASLIVMITIPGLRPELCGKTHLHEFDFWDDAWGTRPPLYEDPDDYTSFDPELN